MKRFLRNNLMLLLFFVSALVVLVITVVVSGMMVSAAKMIEDSTQQEMKALSEAAALLVTGEELEQFVDVADMQKPEYAALRARLNKFSQDSGLMYTYYTRYNADEDKMQYIVDNVMEPEWQDGLDSPLEDLEQAPAAVMSTGRPQAVPLGSYSEGWNGLVTAWAPVRYADGSPSNMLVGVDMQDVYIQAARENTYRMSVVLVVSMFVVLATCFICLMLYIRKVKQAQIASEAKSSFLSRMSHEMRTPMNAIIGLCGMARASGDLGQVQEYLANIDVSSQHLRHVIDDILDISKIESGKMTLEFLPVDLHRELAHIASIIRPQADAKGLAFALQVADDVPQAVCYDVIHTRQVVINLLSNAVKFTPSGGAVSLSIANLGVRDNRCNLEWRVKDNGIGIGADGQKRLFQSFEQADVSTTRKYGGSGLGLAISKQLVEMMDGQIRVESAPGRGSEFIFNIWLSIADPADVADDTDDTGDLDLSGVRILLVEDGEINQMIVMDMMEHYGAEVDAVNNGLAGVDAFRENPGRYDLIFMDIQMPVMDGYEATRAIRAMDVPKAKNIPIIAMTANVFREDVERAFGAGMSGHVKKPFDEEEIRRNIVKALGVSVQKA